MFILFKTLTTTNSVLLYPVKNTNRFNVIPLLLVFDWFSVHVFMLDYQPMLLPLPHQLVVVAAGSDIVLFHSSYWVSLFLSLSEEYTARDCL